jgi:signal transduction histidine kinase/DNA-binding response OmpR family regulator
MQAPVLSAAALPMPRVLIVDDTPANLLALTAVLRPLGATLVEAASGREAIEHIARESFAVVLLDVQMPEMDGFETATQIRALANGREVPIIFLTAIHRDEALIKKGYSAGAADYITKPFDPDIVRARVRAFVDLYRQREQIRQTQVALRTQERDEAVRRLIAFERIATAALGAPDLGAFLSELLAIFVGAADHADAAAVLLREEQRLARVAAVGFGDAPTAVPLAASESFAAKVARERRPLEIDIRTSDAVEDAWLRAHGTKGVFAAPLLHHGDIVGVAYIGSQRQTKFTDEEKRLFAAMIERASWAVAEHVRRARLHEVFLAAPALVTIVSEDHTHELVNPAYASFFEKENRVGTKIDTLGIDALVDVVDRAFESGAAARIDEVDIGRGRHLQLSAHPLRGISGTTASVIVFAIDVTVQVHARTDRVRLLELERTARREAETANRMKDTFLATVSHELRTPLNAMLGWTVQARTHAPPEIDRALAVVERNARAQACIIDDVLDVSRIVSGKLDVQKTRVHFKDVVLSVLDALRPSAATKGVEVSADVPDAILEADPQRLHQALGNLLSNAIKFTPKGGRVTMSGEATPTSVVVRITDTGDGISPDFLPYIFEPFRQADVSVGRRHAGLGLGLAIVKHIVSAHGGTVTAESDGAGHGASFIVELPCSSTMTASPPASAAPIGRSPSAFRGSKILVVDDDDDARALVAHFFAQEGATTAEANSAASALSLVKTFRPDVLVSDIAMPGGDGYGLMHAVRALSPDAGGRTPAVAVTAHAFAADAERSLAAGFQAHLKKPVDFEELRRAVERLLGAN